MSSLLDYHHSECLYQELSLINQQHKEWEDRLLKDRECYNLFSMLKPKVFIDGSQWCVLYGEDIQSGIAGFGCTIKEAILNFNYQFSVAAQNKEESGDTASNSDYTAVLEQGIFDYAIIEHKQFEKESIRKLAAHLNSAIKASQNCA